MYSNLTLDIVGWENAWYLLFISIFTNEYCVNLALPQSVNTAQTQALRIFAFVFVFVFVVDNSLLLLFPRDLINTFLVFWENNLWNCKWRHFLELWLVGLKISYAMIGCFEDFLSCDFCGWCDWGCISRVLQSELNNELLLIWA